MTKHRTTFEMEIDVDFKNAEQAVAHFIDGDWKESFYTCADLDEVAQHLAHGFHFTTDEWSKKYGASSKFVEGFGLFIAQPNGSYKLAPEFDEYGDIVVTLETELSTTDTVMVCPF